MSDQHDVVSDFLNFFAENLHRVLSGECKKVVIKSDAYESEHLLEGPDALHSLVQQLHLLRDVFRPGSTTSTMTWSFEYEKCGIS